MRPAPSIGFPTERSADWGEFHTASILDGRYSPLEVGLKIPRDPDFVPRPRVFVDPPRTTAVDPIPATKKAALSTEPARAQTPPAATAPKVSPLLVGGIAVGLFGLYFFGN